MSNEPPFHDDCPCTTITYRSATARCAHPASESHDEETQLLLRPARTLPTQLRVNLAAADPCSQLPNRPRPLLKSGQPLPSSRRPPQTTPAAVHPTLETCRTTVFQAQELAISNAEMITLDYIHGVHRRDRTRFK